MPLLNQISDYEKAMSLGGIDPLSSESQFEDKTAMSDYDRAVAEGGIDPFSGTDADTDDSWNITKGVKSGALQTAAVLPALGSMAAKTVGWKGGAEKMAGAAQSLVEKAGEYQPDTTFRELIDDPSFGGAVDWAMYTIGNFAPSMAVGFGGAGAGAKIASKIFLGNVIKKGVANGLTKEAAAKTITDAVAKKIALRGAKTGLVASTGALEGGHMYLGDVERHGVQDASVGKATLLGGVAGLVELGIGGFGKGHMRLIEKYLGKAAKKTAGEQPKTALKMLKEVGRQSGGEAFQELTQEELAILHEAWTATPDEEIDNFSKDNILRLLESGAGGGLVGAGGGLVSSAIPTRGATQEEAEQQTAALPSVADMVDQGLAAGELNGQPFTPEMATIALKEAHTAGDITDVEINSFKAKYPNLRDDLGEVVPGDMTPKVATPDTDTTVNAERFKQAPLDPVNNAEYLRKLATPTEDTAFQDKTAELKRDWSRKLADLLSIDGKKEVPIGQGFLLFDTPQGFDLAIPEDSAIELSKKAIDENPELVNVLQKIQTDEPLIPKDEKILLTARDSIILQYAKVRDKEAALALDRFVARKEKPLTEEERSAKRKDTSETLMRRYPDLFNLIRGLQFGKEVVEDLPAGLKGFKFSEDVVKKKSIPAGQGFLLLDSIPKDVVRVDEKKAMEQAEDFAKQFPEMVDVFKKVAEGQELTEAEGDQLLLDTAGIKLPYTKLTKDEKLGGQPTKKYIKDRVARRRKARIESERAEKQAEKLRPKPSKTRTLRGAIKEMGGINFLNFTGELKDLNQFDQKALSRKEGLGIDQAVDELIADNWLPQDTTVEGFLEELRTKPKDFLSRDRITSDVSAKKEHELSAQEKKLKKALAYQEEAPPKGEYITMKAEDLPEGERLTLMTDKATEGWDTYQVVESADPFEVVLQDGVKITLSPMDKVQVLKKDLPVEKKAKAVEPTKTIPEFKRTEDAVAFGKKATPEQTAELKRLWDESVEKGKGLTGQAQFDAGYKSQLYREAYEEAKAAEPVKPAEKAQEKVAPETPGIEKPKPKEAKPFEPDFKKIPLETIKVKMKALHESGKTITVQENAKEALETVDKDIERYYELLSCL